MSLPATGRRLNTRPDGSFGPEAGAQAVLRIHVTMPDLTRTRIVSGAGPAVETLLAMDLLDQRDGGVGFGRWRETAKQLLGPKSTWAAALRPPTAAMFEGGTGTDEGIDDNPPRTPPAEQPSASAATLLPGADPALRRFFDLAVAPYWPRVSGYLEADRRHRARIFVGGGV